MKKFKYTIIGLGFPLFCAILFLDMSLEMSEGYIWKKVFEGKAGDAFKAVKQDAFSNLIVMGNTNAIRYRKSNVVFKKYDIEGNPLDEFVYGGIEDELGNDFDLLDDGFVVAGATGPRELFPWLTKLDKSYEMVWEVILSRAEGTLNKVIKSNADFIAVGHFNGMPLLIKVDAKGAVIDKVVLDKEEGEIVDIILLNGKCYCLINNCIDCYKNKAPSAAIHVYNTESLTKLSELDNKVVQIGRGMVAVESGLAIAGETYVPKSGIEGALLLFDTNTFTVTKSALFGRDWDEEINGCKLDSEGNIILFGRTLSDQDSRKKMETYVAWSVTVDQNLKARNEYFFGDGLYDAFESYLTGNDGADIYVGSVDNQAGVVNRQVKDIKNFPKTGSALPEENESPLKDLQWSQNNPKEYNFQHGQQATDVVFTIINPNSRAIKDVKLSFELEGILNAEVPKTYSISELNPTSSEKVVIPIVFEASTAGASGILKVSSTILASPEYINVNVEEIKTVSIELDAKVLEAKLDTNNFSTNLLLAINLRNNGNAALEKGVLEFNKQSTVNLDLSEKEIAIANGGVQTINVAINIAQEGLRDLKKLTSTLRDAEGNPLKSQDVSLLNAGQLADIQDQIELITAQRNAKLKKAKIPEIAILTPKTVGTFETERKVVAISTDKLAEIKTKEADKSLVSILDDVDIDWNYTIGKKTAVTEPLQSIRLKIEGFVEDIESVSVLINGEEKVLDLDKAEVTQEEKKLVVIFNWEQALEEGTTEIQAVLQMLDQDFIKGDPIYFEYIEKKNNLYIVSIGVPDNFSSDQTKLKYTSKDAIDFDKVFRSDVVKDDFKEIKSFVLTTKEETTKANILKIFTEIEILNPGTDDLLVCYISTHAFPDQTDLYIAPSDYNFKATYSSAINFTSFLNEYLKRRKCTKLLLLDVCHSGAVLGSKEGEDELEKTEQINDYFVSTLNSLNNMYFISSSKAGEYSYEVDELQNSAFMAAIKLMANSSNSDICKEISLEFDTDNDRVINFSEMTQYIKKKVPCIVQKSRKAEQNPKSSRLGNDDFKLFDL